MSRPSLQTLNLGQIAKSLSIGASQVEATVSLLDEGNTVPFITRYRKDQTGGLDEEQIRSVQEQILRLRQIEERKQTILRSIDSQGKLTDALRKEIERSDSVKRLEDLYLPYKPKKQTRATIAQERGLQPLAEEILSQNPACADLNSRAAAFVNAEKEISSAADALLGAGHIIAERYSERADLRHKVRKQFRRTGKLVSVKAEGDDKQADQYRDYFEFRQRVNKVPPHRILAINRGERAKHLRVKIEVDLEVIEREALELLLAEKTEHQEFLQNCVRDALNRLILPSLEREARRDLTENAEQHAVEVFSKNLKNLLLQAPVRKKRVLAIDPGFKNGCKLAALDEFGSVLSEDVIYLTGSDKRKSDSREKLAAMIREQALSVVAIGNGTACRETEELLAEMIAGELADQNVSYVVVNEAGASVYSASPLGREELPDHDAIIRGAISIGRRLQDPLSELVKIDPASIGVGLYQHDVKAKHLRSSLDAVVESCVNYVGVDVNTASPALLRYVSGLNQLTARRLYDYRVQHGPFADRNQLMQVPGFGETTFVQAAGFLKVTSAENPLDATWIHPESYQAAEKVLASLQCDRVDLGKAETGARLAQQAEQIDYQQLAEQLHVGELLLRDIVNNLCRPGRDPREDLPPPIFRQGVVKIDDLTVGMELTGKVLNVVDFGVFVDIGLSDSALVHVSHLANRFIRDPHEVAAVGDTIQVWVLEVDKDRRRVSLSMIPPGSEKPAREKKQQRYAKSANRQDDKKPAAKKRTRSKPSTGKKSKSRSASKSAPKAKPRPVVPITEAMKEGSEPMRAFSDLTQFFQEKTMNKQRESSSESSESDS